MTAFSDTPQSELHLPTPVIPVAAVVYALSLVPILPLSALGPVLFCLMLGFGGGAVGRAISLQRTHVLALAFLAALTGALVGIEELLGIAALSDIPVLIPLFCALTFGLYALNALVAEDHIRTRFIWGAFGLAAALTHLAAQVTDLTAPLVVAVLIYALCLAIFLRLWQQWNRPYALTPLSSNRPAATEVVLGSLDILCAGLFLDPLSCALYLIPRSLAELLRTVYFALERHLGHSMVRSRSTLTPSAEAARVNLGFLLIGGACALLLCLIGPIVLAALSSSYAQMLPLLYWFVLGQSAPALLGAGPLLMKIFGLETHYARLSWALIPVGVGIHAWGVRSDHLAQAMAIFFLTQSVACAAFLIRRRGIWPGLTVLFHRKLSL